MQVSVIGLGKLGLPIAVQIASKGFQVKGGDINPVIESSVNAGISPVQGEMELDTLLSNVVSAELLTVTTSIREAVASADVVLVVVPLMTDNSGVPDFRNIDAAVTEIAQGLKANSLVVFETTLPIGTTRERFAPLLESCSGHELSKALYVAFSPERVLTGRVFADLRKYPKIIGGICNESTARAAAFYEAVLDFEDRPDLSRPNGVWNLGSSDAAEFVKLAETTYRDVNIGLANEFARRAAESSLDFRAIVEAANSQPYSHIHAAGIAVGGHCIPVYPEFFLQGAPWAEIVRAGRSSNLQMPDFILGFLERSNVLEQSRVVVLGAAYRGSVKEVAHSGVHSIVQGLRERGALPLVHDPLFSDSEISAMGYEPFHRGDHAEFSILQADHPEYLEWTPADIVGLQEFFDGRDFTSESNWPGVRWSSINDFHQR